MTTPTYRPDIDGLRAIAVLAVVFYHSGITVFSGGYVGVDVFFVISGFLITTIIVREIDDGSFSVANFYERRMRRILPASIATTAGCLVVGYYLFDTRDLTNLAHSAIANNLFLSNVYFYMQAGYFDVAAELKPLLHTWSLSLEEQYYVVTPVLLMLVARYFNRKYLLIIIPSAVISFAACLYGTTENQGAVFYMLPTRAWELLIGSILAIARLPPIRSDKANQSLALGGMAMILVSIFRFDNQIAFPGAYAALPTLGTAILIYTGRSRTTLINAALSLRPVVFIGLISYSLYLWHWPAIVFSKYVKSTELSNTESIVMLLLIFVISVLSWRFIETPFRRKRLLPARKQLFLGSLGAVTVLIGASLFTTVSILDSEWRRWRSCEGVEERLSAGEGLCVIGEVAGGPSFIVWGDSHARALNSAAHASALRVGVTGVIASQSACPPLLGIERIGRSGCVEFNNAVNSYIDANPTITTVFLVGRWTNVTEGKRYKNEEGKPIEFRDTLEPGDRAQNSPQLLESGLGRTIESLRASGRNVVLVGPVPEVGHDVPSINRIALITDKDVNAMIAPTAKEFQDRNESVLSVLSKLESNSGIRIISPSTLLCNEVSCNVALADGTALYRDDHHLSTDGARYISEMFDPAFASPFRDAP
jgi:peptidoglycan/LPS O-acetylase OafA/YrhL